MKTKSAAASAMTRAYTTVQFRSVDEKQRIIEGIASTISPDSYNDTIDPMGIEYKGTVPFLYQHNARQPIGKVTSLKKSKDGLIMTAQIAPDMAAAPYIAEAWALINSGLIPGLSIGFVPLEESYDRERGGYNYSRVRLLEISAVTIAANEDASITSIRTADIQARAASGSERSNVVRLDQTPAGAPVSRKRDNVKIREQITSFENKRAAHDARMTAIMEGSEGATLDAAQAQEYDGLEADVKAIDEHLVRLRAQEARNVASASSVTAAATELSAARNENPRATSQITVRPNVEKGTAFVRLAMVMAKSRLTGMDPLRLIQSNKQWMDQTPEIDMYVRTVIEAGDTTTSGWASQLVPAAQQLENEYLDLLRPMTLLGRIPGFNNVPFNVTVPIGTADGTHSWVGEDVSAPVGKLTISSATLEWAKTASIIAITKELAMLSTPQAEGVVRNALLKGNAAYLDVQFVSLNAAVTKSSPAGILNGISQTLGTGTTPATFLADLNTLLAKLGTNNQNISGLVLMTSLNQLLAISLMRSSLGTYLYPNVSIRILPDGSNGDIGGIPVYASNAIAGTTASTSRIIAMVASEVLMADASGATIDISTEASLEMNTTPLAGDQSPLTTSVAMKSLWQAGLVGIKVTRPITWKVARTSAVEYLNNTNYLTA